VSSSPPLRDRRLLSTLIARCGNCAEMVDCDGLLWSKAVEPWLLVVFLKRRFCFHRGIKTALAYKPCRGASLVADQAETHIVYGVARIARYTEIHKTPQTMQTTERLAPFR
jgi:hypothetical protein